MSIFLQDIYQVVELLCALESDFNDHRIIAGYTVALYDIRNLCDKVVELAFVLRRNLEVYEGLDTITKR